MMQAVSAGVDLIGHVAFSEQSAITPTVTRKINTKIAKSSIYSCFVCISTEKVIIQFFLNYVQNKQFSLSFTFCFLLFFYQDTIVHKKPLLI